MTTTTHILNLALLLTHNPQPHTPHLTHHNHPPTPRHHHAQLHTDHANHHRPRHHARAQPPVATATPSSAEEAAHNNVGVEAGATAASSPLEAVYRFSRPHTIRGTLLACATGVGRALLESPEQLALLPALLPRALLGVLALLLSNLFIVGINQIYDVEIDRVNKPFLPIASGALSARAAWALILSAAATGLALVRSFFSPLIFALYAFGTTMGGLYSVPPVQLKRFPLAAGATIATCRGFLLNFGVYYATREALGKAFQWNPQVAFLARFMTVFGLVIAVTKDLPDIDGDRAGGIETFSTRAGPHKVAKGASVALGLNYAAAVASALLAPAGTFRTWWMVTAHAAAGGWLLRSYTRLDTASRPSIKQFYAQIWNLFYFEYMAYLFI